MSSGQGAVNRSDIFCFHLIGNMQLSYHLSFVFRCYSFSNSNKPDNSGELPESIE